MTDADCVGTVPKGVPVEGRMDMVRFALKTLLLAVCPAGPPPIGDIVFDWEPGKPVTDIVPGCAMMLPETPEEPPGNAVEFRYGNGAVLCPSDDKE